MADEQLANGRVARVIGRGHRMMLLERLIEKSRRSGTYIPFSPHTAYINTIPPHREERSDGDHALEWKIRSLLRWNAIAMVVNSNREHAGVGGQRCQIAVVQGTLEQRGPRVGVHVDRATQEVLTATSHCVLLSGDLVPFKLTGSLRSGSSCFALGPSLRRGGQSAGRGLHSLSAGKTAPASLHF